MHLLTLFSTVVAIGSISVRSNYVDVVDMIVSLKHHRVDVKNINIIIATERKKCENLIEDLSKKLMKEKTISTIETRFLFRAANRRMFYNIIIVNEIENFKDLVPHIKDDVFNYSGYFIILFERAKLSDVQEIFQFLWDFYVHNVITIRSNDNSISIDTFMPFTESACNKTSPIEIGKYRHGKFISRPADFFPEKFQNFHGCPLKVTTFASLAPSVLKRDHPNGTFELYGRDIELMRTLAEELNFRTTIKYLHEYGSWGIIFENGSISGAMGEVHTRAADLAWGNLNLKLDRIDKLGFSFGYYLETLIFVIPKGEKLSSFQKLVRPFEVDVWIACSATLFVSILIIFIVTHQSQFARKYIFGGRVGNPYMNLMTIIVGGSQRKLPALTFARSLLMMFILLCLVIRTIYQGSLYKFLQANDKKPDAATIEEMAQKGFKFCMIPSYDDMTRTNAAMRGKREIIKANDIIVVMNKTLESSYKGSVLTTLSDVIYKNKLKAFRKEELYTICKVSDTCNFTVNV
jgi:ABC-type amino acid transport substrate-binding protein